MNTVFRGGEVMEQTEKSIKTQRLVAMILVLVGSGALSLSLFTDAF